VPWAQYRTLYLEQSDYFLYIALDLGHAAGQPPSVARAQARQLERYAHSARVRKLVKRHPRLAPLRKRALRLEHRAATRR
jgi:hypothetical protein